MLKIILVSALILPLMIMAGCNTMEGFGKDLSTLGTNIEKTADKAK